MARPPHLQIPPGVSSEFSDIVIETDSRNSTPTQTANLYPPRPTSSRNRSRSGSISLTTPGRPTSGRNPSPLATHEWTPSSSQPQRDEANVPLLPANDEVGSAPSKATPPQGAGRYTYPLADPFADDAGGRFTMVLDDPLPSHAYSDKTYSKSSPWFAHTPTSAASSSTYFEKTAESPLQLSPLDSPPPPGRPEKRFSISGFEPPQWRNLALHALACGLAYPLLLAFVVLARGRSLFWARVAVGAGCGIVGATLGMSLIKLARGIIEAATWATVIHQSRMADDPGVPLKNLAAESDDHASAMTALRLLWDRHTYPGADRENRRLYDSRPWALWVIFFASNVIIASLLPFSFGRLVNIESNIVHQYEGYSEVPVKGVLSPADIQRAADMQPAFENYLLTWTLSPFAVHGGLPAAVSFPWNNDSVYFSEVILSQLLPNGSGFGTFEASSTTVPVATPGVNTTSATRVVQGDRTVMEPGSVLRFPRWGIRIKCTKVPDPAVNIVPLSENNHTYLFTPRDSLRPLFTEFGMPFPQELEQPFNFSSTLQDNDTVPAALDRSKIALGAVFWDNGVAHSIKNTPLSLGEVDNSFVTLENILVRMNTSFAPNGSFGTLRTTSFLDRDGRPTFIGYDAAVCLEIYEPWVLQVYNSSVGVPTTMGIVDKAATLSNVGREMRKGKEIEDRSISRGLNSTDMAPVYITSRQNSVNQILKDNGRDSFYVPSPTLISFTNGEGPYGYTSLSPELYAKTRAEIDASNMLPYFAGSGSSVAWQFPDREITNTSISQLQMGLTIVFVFLMGLVSVVFVPKLPLDLPRRGFDLYSWMIAFRANELVSERNVGLRRHVDLTQVVERTEDIRVRYVG